MSLRDQLPCTIKSDLLVNGQPQVLECRLLRRIGEGGMATVYLAEMDGRRVAVKYMSTELLHNQASALDRFIREASLLKDLRHPNIVRVYNLGVDQEDCPFLVMELVENAKTLATVIDVWRYRREQAGEPDPATGRYRTSLMPLKVLLPLLRQVVVALAELHARDIVHRDIKPDNVLVTEVDGRLVAKLTDLGISKSLSSKDPQLTAENCVVGTPFYMAPEAVTGCRFDPSTGRSWYVGKHSDDWSLGVVVYELITGRKPFDADLEDLPLTNRQRSSQEQANLLAANIIGKVADAKFRHAPLVKFVAEPNQSLAELVDICLVKEPWLRAPDAGTLLALIEMAEREEERRERVSEDFGPEPASIRVGQTISEGVGDLPTMASNPPPSLSVEPHPKTVEYSAEAADKPRAKSKLLSRGVVTGFILLVLAAAGYVGYGSLKDGWRAPLVALTGPGETESAASSALPKVPPSVPQPIVFKRPPGPGPTQGTQAYRIYRQGVASFQAGDCTTATKDMRAILAAYTSFPEPFRILGECARRSGDLAGARDNFRHYLGFEGVAPLPPEAMKVVNP